jgi:hypothetical protein
MKLSYLPLQIVLVGLPPDLAAYLIAWFGKHWPTARVRQASDTASAGAMDLCIVDQQPWEPVHRPTLWLAELGHSRSVHQLSTNLWRTAMPISGQGLERAMRCCLSDRRWL